MAAIPFMFSPEDNPEENEELMQSAYRIMVAGHAMADYILSEENEGQAFRAFCDFLECENDEDRAVLRENIGTAHDALQMMASRAQAALVMQQFHDIFIFTSAAD